jgi:hypothetical protein
MIRLPTGFAIGQRYMHQRLGGCQEERLSRSSRSDTDHPIALLTFNTRVYVADAGINLRKQIGSGDRWWL